MKKFLLSFTMSTIFLISGCGVKIIYKNSDFELGNQSVHTKIVTASDELVTLNIVDWSDSTKEQRKELNQLFMKDYPNVTINYTTLTQAQFNESVISGIRSGNAPDLFPLPQTIKLEMALNNDWFIPLNTYLDDSFFDSFNDSAFNENLTSRDGNIYLLPEAQEIPSTLIFYNETLLEEVGVSLDELPVTWDEFISLTKMISEKGSGEYFGLVTSGGQKNRIELELRSLSQLAGAKIGYSDQVLLHNGENQLGSNGVLDAFNFYGELYKAGSFHPDSAFISAPEARKLFAENKA
ncbi:MAG: ABC transporter substrate-binding protein, partial [Turicibacter sp.]